MITLGIIGIVAALTIPTLMHNYKKKEIETKLKRVYSVMNQAVGLSIANGTWTQPPTDKRYDSDALHDWLKTALYPYLKVEDCYNSSKCKQYSENYPITAILPDGSSLNFANNQQIHIYYSFNSSTTREDAKWGVDTFKFFLDYSNTQNKLGYFYPSGYANAYTDDEAVEDGQLSDIAVYGDRDGMIKYCSSKYTDYGATCALLIMHDGWKISDDYPVKF